MAAVATRAARNGISAQWQWQLNVSQQTNGRRQYLLCRANGQLTCHSLLQGNIKQRLKKKEKAEKKNNLKAFHAGQRFIFTFYSQQSIDHAERGYIGFAKIHVTWQSLLSIYL